jgi:hypothetical protein
MKNYNERKKQNHGGTWGKTEKNTEVMLCITP